MNDAIPLPLELEEAFGIDPTRSIESYAVRLRLFLSHYLTLPGLTALKLREYHMLDAKLDEYDASVAITFTRRQLYSSLTVEPFFSALQLINIHQREDIVSQNLLILAHLLIARGHDDYPAYLAFYKMAESAHTPLFSRSFLQSCTLDELRMETQSLAQTLESEPLHSFASFLKRRDPRTLSKPKQSITSGVNRHERIADQTSFGRIASVQFSDEDGSQTSALLQYTPDLALSEHKQKLLFSKKQAGLHNALYNFESNTPWASHNATPAEIAILLKNIDAALIDGVFNQLSTETAGLLALLFLKLFGLAEPEALTLLNAGSPNYHAEIPTSNNLVYEIDKKTQRLDAHIRFNAQLLTVKTPTCKDARINHVAREHIDIGLPFPIPQLLKQALRKVQAAKRNHRSLSRALGVSEEKYRQWLRKHIKQSRLDTIGLTPTRIERTFEHFAKEHVPEIAFNYLRGKATVQHHYVTVERAEVERSLKTVWFDFLGEASIKRTSSSSDNFPLSFSRAHHDTVGSSHVVRQEVLDAILAACVRYASNELASAIDRLNTLALFVYTRIAATAALRPVKEPFPAHCHFHGSLGLLSVADKRAHHKEERRLIVLTKSCATLLKAFLQAANRISTRYNLPVPGSGVMFYDHATQAWEHLSGKNASAMLASIAGDTIENRSLRHVAATAFISVHLEQATFCQSATNLLMNHVQSNVSVLNYRSLINIESLTQTQRQFIDESDLLSRYDANALQLIGSIEKSS